MAFQITQLKVSRISFLILSGLFFLFITPEIQDFNNANASTSLGQSIKQFQENLQSDITREIQSNIKNGNYNCNSSNNISIQSQTNNNNQQATSTTMTYCGDSAQVSSFLDKTSLEGIIVSAEYDLKTDSIVNSIYGNWSFNFNENGFNASFVIQPLSNNKSTDKYIPIDVNKNAVINTNTSTPTNNEGNTRNLLQVSSPTNQTGLSQTSEQNSNTTSYDLTNFKSGSINTINSNVILQGKIDVKQKIISNDSVESNVFEDVDVSIAVLSDRTLVVNFGNQTTMFDIFRNIPLVGFVKNME
jgi:hypothetical protein